MHVERKPVVVTRGSHDKDRKEVGIHSFIRHHDLVKRREQRLS